VDRHYLLRKLSGEAARVLDILVANGPQYPRRIVALSEGTIERDGPL